MYKIVPAERQARSKEAITKDRCKPSKNGLQRSFLAPPARLELTTFRLGGGPSILVRYGGIYRKYSTMKGSGIRTVRLLGGVRSILLSYRAYGQLPGYCNPNPGGCQRRIPSKSARPIGHQALFLFTTRPPQLGAPGPWAPPRRGSPRPPAPPSRRLPRTESRSAPDWRGPSD